MANSQIKIDLIFQANTQNALNNIQQLSELLNKISSKTTIGIDGGSLQQGVESARALQTALAQATNVDTGKIDLIKLNTSLKQSGTSITQLSKNLQSIGQDGQQAFLKMAKAISQAETPMFQLDKRLKDFGISLVNTVKWQIASNMIHGIQGAIEGAINYAEKLNGALNDIRIVTGKSIDEMSKFAEAAAQSAKALSTTTTEYAKAALIFYQQGLEGKAVTERAEVVLKLSQVTGESAQKVSDQMTAVWNNFYDGSKSLEYYADVVAKLGADTASSSDEIIKGLEKFAATADTIGLSYEYAASSLATVVAETRQAPEVVGNAFKTLFARLQGLSLGETLEDGTDLNKYSEALGVIGVQIKDQYGALKDADVILKETAAAWGTLEKDQKVALAQTVGGMRQYTQFMALMENWDTVELNVEVAELSEGTLTKQQEIWAESWEAADKRVEQSKNQLYSEIINDKFMIGLKDMWAGLLKGITTFIDKAGGIIPVILMLVGVFSKQLFPIVTAGFNHLKDNLAVLTGKAAKEIAAMQNSVRTEIATMLDDSSLSEQTKSQLRIADKLIESRQNLALASKNMTEAERQVAERRMAIVEATGQEIQKSLELQDQLQSEIDLLKDKASQSSSIRGAMAEQYTSKKGFKELGEGEVDLSEDKDYEAYFGKSRAEIGQAAMGKSDYGLNKALAHKDQQIQAAETEAELKILQQQKRELLEMKRIREEMSKKDFDQISAGDATGFGMYKIDENDEVSAGTQNVANMQSKVMETLGGREQEDANTGETVIVADSSIKNLEKVTQLQGKYTTALKKTKAIQDDLSKSKEKTAKAEKDLNKDKNDPAKQAAYNKALKEQVQSYKDSEKAMKKLAQTAGFTDKQMTELDEAYKLLNGTDEESKKGMEELDRILGGLSQGFDQTTRQLDDFIDSIVVKLRGKIPDEELDELVSKLRQVGTEAAITEDKMEEFNDELEKGDSETPKKNFSDIAASFASIAGTVVGAIQGVQALFSAFDEGATPMENLMTYLTSLMSLLPLVGAAFKGLAAIHKKTEEDKTKTTIKENTKRNASNLATAATAAFKSAVETFGWPGIIVGAALAAAIIAGGIFALTAGAPKQTQGEKKEQEIGENVSRLTEEYKAATEAAKNFKNSVSDYKEGINSLGELDKNTSAYKKTLEETNAKARELIETYNLLSSDYYFDPGTKAIIIKDDVLEEKQQEFEKKENNAKLSLYRNRILLEQTKKSNDIDNIDNSFISKKDANSLKNIKSILEVGDKVLGVMKFITPVLGGPNYSSVDTLQKTYQEYSETADMKIKQESQSRQNTMDYLGNIINEYYKNNNNIDFQSTKELQDYLLNQLDEANPLYEKIKNANEDAMNAILDWAQKLRDSTKAIEEYNREILGVIVEEKVSNSVSKYAEPGTEEYNLRMRAATAYYEDRVSTNASEIEKDFDTHAPDITDLKNTGEVSDSNGPFDEYKQLANKYNLNLDNGQVVQDVYGVKFDYDKATNITEWAKIMAESKGYTGVQVTNNRDGTFDIHYTGGQVDGQDVGTGTVTWDNKQIQQWNKDTIINAAARSAIGEEVDGATWDIIQRDIDNAQKENQKKYGVDFSSYLYAAMGNKDVAFDFSSLAGVLTPEMIEDIQGMSNEELIYEFFGISPVYAKSMSLFKPYLQKEETQSDESEETQSNESGIKTVTLPLALAAGPGDESGKTTDQNPNSSQSETNNQEDSTNSLATAITGAMKDAMNLDNSAEIDASAESSLEELELDVDTFKAYRDILESTNGKLEDNHTLLNKVAIADMRLDKGVKAVAKDWEELSKALNSEDLLEQAEALGKLNEPVKDMLGYSDEEFELLPENFVANNLDLIQQVVDGVPGAIQQLRKKANAEKVLFNIKAVVDDGELKPKIAELNDIIVNYDISDIEVGAEIDNASFLQACQEMIAVSGASVADIQNYFKSIGFRAKLSEENGVLKLDTIVKDQNYMDYYTKSIASPSARDTGGSSSPAEKIQKTKHSEIVTRYEELEDKLDNIRDAADKASKSMDRLYGTERLTTMKQQNKYLKNEIDLLKQKRKQSDKYLKEDMSALAEAASEAGVRLTFNENGDVTNYTQQLDRLWKQLNAAENKQSKMSTKEEQDSYGESHIKPIEDAINTLQSAYEQYKNTREEIENLDMEIQDAIYAWQDSNAEILTYEIELKAEVNDRNLREIEYYLSKMEDDFYLMSESAVLMGEKIALAEKSLQDNQENISNLEKMYKAGEISQAAYIEGLKSEQDALYSNLETLQDLDKTMLEYYSNTLAAANEELDEYTVKLDDQTSLLDHYRTLLDLTGQTQNFQAIGKVLEGQTKVIENSYEVAKSKYDWLVSETIKKRQEMEDAFSRGDFEAAEVFESEWKSAEEAMKEAQDNMLSMAETWAEKLKEVLENKLADLSEVLEKAFTGGKSFDELSMQMERAQGIQEEYLTTTNKIYETNKMIRNVQNEIDKTTNTVAKQKLKAFQQETQQLQNQEQLSKFELDLQQKKYNLLLAEIALQEAQNAKNTVRLQRDSEGNFGYIYTADQNKVSGAEQKVEDAENDLYNTRLESLNNYAGQRVGLLQELHSSMLELNNKYYIEQILSEEEYNREKEAIQNYYFERLKQNSSLYAIATGKDSTIVQEAWSSSLDIMNQNAKDLVMAVDDYLAQSRVSFLDYKKDINKIAEETGVDLDTLEKNVKDVSEESEKLTKTIKNKVIPALQDELNEVSDTTYKYALHRGEISLVAQQYETLNAKIGLVVSTMAGLSNACSGVEETAKKAASEVGKIYDMASKLGLNGDIIQKLNDTLSLMKQVNEQGSSTSSKPPSSFEPRDSVMLKYDTKWYEKENGAFVLKGNNINEPGKDSYWSKSEVGTTTIAEKAFWNGQWYYRLEGKFGNDWFAEKDLSKVITDYSKLIIGYDTGGYTGEWGPEGKLAFLHQKELVLNANQTEDLLMTMELLDSIIKQIDTMTMNNKINQMSAAMNQAVNTMYKEQMAQEIHIEANFPNATDRNEIYQALEMLANDTSQFINR